MRLFAAVWPPRQAVGELDEAVESLRGLPGAERLRWAAPDAWHFTLSFYGEATEDQARALGTRLARVAARTTAPVPCRLSGGGRFGDRTLWVGLHREDSDVAALKKLAAATTAAGRRADLLPPDVPASFHPHLTLARAKGRGAIDLRPYVERLAPFRGSGWIARELLLVRSTLPAGGVPGERPRYEPLERWPLGP
ncbi:RNA 2',3'-cyclic phosphodiesterase [Streptomyces albus subsp. chlorinus]|uniref:RNA 2',3'-cyclic phosphodiesterase n=1 Tax=Streptomyces albus TaxID=1888 RepID=UPI00156E3221|nr:RNA 2',3'-cyclic phosphodiesterase [Streptomyces albus]NSC22374.1 RNA 2',3'-cyclic phosphodiesterase [Streptomyces albus subsp. chlorinus]